MATNDRERNPRGATMRLLIPLVVAVCAAVLPTGVFAVGSVAADGPQMLELAVIVVGPNGEPVAGAKVTPWALRSSLGHGLWTLEAFGRGEPPVVVTDEQGRAAVPYPRYVLPAERVTTLAVSLKVDHPEHAVDDDLHIDVPLEQDAPHEIRLAPGAVVEVRPTIGGEPTDPAETFVLWSDPRSYSEEARVTPTDDGGLRLPPMAPGENRAIVVRIVDGRATDFSNRLAFRATEDGVTVVDAPLEPAVTIRGRLADAVPRPIEEGRVSARALPASREEGRYYSVDWSAWSPVSPDGDFLIKSWPAWAPMQLIGLCEGYHVTSGETPPEAGEAGRHTSSIFTCPQVYRGFDGSEGPRSITVPMTPMGECRVLVRDLQGEPVEGLTVASWPNVKWWNGGSQGYCDSLVNSERLIVEREYRRAVDQSYGDLYQAPSDADGVATLSLPAGNQGLTVISEVGGYEAAIFLGQRRIRTTVNAGETTEESLVVQPVGTERLGDWESLAGVVFGCSTKKGRAMCARPDVQRKMRQFEKMLREADDPRDPAILAKAYTLVSEAFAEAGEVLDAAKWIERAEEQARLAESRKP